MLTQREQRKEAKEFAEKWEAIGYEKGDSARFWLSLLNEVYGVDHPAEFIRFEDQVMLDNTSFIDGYIPSTHVLIEQKSIDKDLRKGIRQSDGSLLSPFQQAKRYSIELPYDDRPRWIVLCNFKEFHIFDMNKPQSEPEVVYLKDLEEDYYRLNFLVDEEDHNVKRTTEVSIQAGELVGVLYDALLKQYQNPEDEETLKDLNILCVRLVFCFYAEDAGLFGHHNMFHDYLANYKDNPASFRDVLIKLFRVLDQEEHERDPYQSDELLAFPYVNGGLFEKDDVVIPRINEKIIDIILNQTTASFDWSKISPTIFGGVFESTLNPETRRSGGMHYTSIENIHKVIDPLFMDQLREEFKEISNLKTLSIKKRRFEELQDKMASLKFLDPAAGTAGFLIAGMHDMLSQTNDYEDRRAIKKDQLFGIESQSYMFTIATTNMILRGDGKSNLENADFLKQNPAKIQKEWHPTVGMMNPPYSQGSKTNSDLYEISFTEHLLDCMVEDGRVAVIVPQSTMTGKTKVEKEIKANILKHHTLEGVITLNKNTFYGVGVNPCIAIFTAGIPHHKDKICKFINFEDDGFEVAKHVGLVETSSAKDKKQHLLDVWFDRIEADTKFCVNTTIESDDEWLHSFYYFNDETPTDEDFRNTIADYITFEVNMITHGRGYLFGFDDEEELEIKLDEKYPEYENHLNLKVAEEEGDYNE